MKSNLRNIIFWLAVGAILFFAFESFNPNRSSSSVAEIPYSEFIAGVRSGAVESASIEDRTIKATTVNGEEFTTYNPGDLGLVTELLDYGVRIDTKPPASQSLLKQLFISSFPILLLIGLWIYLARNMGGMGGKGGGNPFSFGKSKANMLEPDKIKTRFNDVAGVEEAKEDVKELVDFLKNPKHFTDLGGTIPKGVLMVGPPGTGKTLLAKAIAGEASVPFFTISGSDFVEMFVGVGASRVRDMFAQARKHAPCIIFVDEIDAVGRHRGAGLGGGHDEREQTLNQLLVEMDGFEGHEGVIMIAATNRPDVLDPALLRPGRFDRQVVVALPDIRGREQILKVHLKKLPKTLGLKPSVIARGTPGFSGADLANLVNEAALIAVKEKCKKVLHSHLEKAKDKIMMGAERKSMVMDENEKKLTAYHEAGHAIVGLSLPDHDPVYKVSIIPRGRALGVTMFLPEKDRYSLTKDQLNAQIASLYGGRIAEEMIFGEGSVTTGASNDIERATTLARSMVKQWGLDGKLGPLAYQESEGEVFLGKQQGNTLHISEKTQQVIDEQVSGLIQSNYKKAEHILKEKKSVLHAMADCLMLYETIDKDQLDDLMQGKSPRPPKDWNDDNSGDDDLVVDEAELKAKKPARKPRKKTSTTKDVQGTASKPA